jgi:Nickel responsive protein SCO4226-like
MGVTPELKMYAIRRRSGWATVDELREAGERSATVGDTEMASDIRWIRSYVVAEADGRLGTVCVYQASSSEKIREHAARAGLPADEIIEVGAGAPLTLPGGIREDGCAPRGF